jgi:hypothetical protein
MILTNYVLLPTLSFMEHFIGLSTDTGLVHEPNDLLTSYWYWSYLYSAHVMVRDSVSLAQKKMQQQQQMVTSSPITTAEFNSKKYYSYR